MCNWFPPPFFSRLYVHIFCPTFCLLQFISIQNALSNRDPPAPGFSLFSILTFHLLDLTYSFLQFLDVFDWLNVHEIFLLIFLSSISCSSKKGNNCMCNWFPPPFFCRLYIHVILFIIFCPTFCLLQFISIQNTLGYWEPPPSLFCQLINLF